LILKVHLQAQEWSVPERRISNKGGRMPARMKKELLTKLGHKQYVHRRWREGQVTQEMYRDTAQVSKGWS